MPKNKAQKIKNLQNDAEFAEEAVTLKEKKAALYPPSLNRISKNKQ